MNELTIIVKYICNTTERSEAILHTPISYCDLFHESATAIFARAVRDSFHE
jgi:hypothetical protein